MKLFLLALLLTAAAQAEPRRIAVIVGANKGALGRDSLRYSYGDAEQVAAVLTQVGQFAAGDVRVLRDPEPQAVLDELDRDLALLQPDSESLLVFYYSGHADAVALYPNGKALSFAQLRQRLESKSATVRIGIIDACSGGGWTGAKGIYPSAPFVVDVPLVLTGEGSVLIASSSGVESAHESEQINGSFFTHHLVAGLRGAASQHGDGVVTLTDAFAYARERTIRDSSAVADPQHPSFSMNLRGRSDLPLTRIAQSKTLVELSETEGPLQLIHLGSGLVVLEVPPGKRVMQLSVPAGRYLVRRQQSGGNYSREVTVEEDKPVSVDEANLRLSPFPHEGSKAFEEGSDGWPLSVNDRPVSLSRGMLELKLGALAENNLVIRRAPFTGPDGGAAFGSTWVDGSPLGLDGSVRFGATDRLTLSVGAIAATKKDCSQLIGCHQIDRGISGGALFLILPGVVELAAVADISSIGDVPLAGGFTVRFGGGHLVTLQLTAEYMTNLSDPKPSAEFDFQTPRRSGYLGSALLTVQLIERLALDAGATTNKRPSDFDRYAVPLTFGLTLALNHHFDLRGQLLFHDVFTGGINGPGDERQFGLSLTFRP